ncbi:MAG: response regulator transcription factor [Candidatus Aquicultorales bacterium]
MERAKVLVVEDESKIAELVKAYFEAEGFEVRTAEDGKTGLDLALEYRPDLIVLDLMLPGSDGYEITRAVRTRSQTPIIMLTARSDEVDKLIGLELGADDYVTKPFSPRELVARAKAVLRRTGGRLNDDGSRSIQAIGPFRFDFDRIEAFKEGAVLDLTPSEFTILTTLALNPGRVYSRSQLVEAVHGQPFDAYERTIDFHIKNIRKKIEDNPGSPSFLKTVFGFGYRFEVSRD